MIEMDMHCNTHEGRNRSSKHMAITLLFLSRIETVDKDRNPNPEKTSFEVDRSNSPSNNSSGHVRAQRSYRGPSYLCLTQSDQLCNFTKDFGANRSLTWISVLISGLAHAVQIAPSKFLKFGKHSNLEGPHLLQPNLMALFMGFNHWLLCPASLDENV